MFLVPLQAFLPGVPEAGGLGAAAGQRRGPGDLRDGAALQRNQGAPALGQEGRGSPGAAHPTAGTHPPPPPPPRHPEDILIRRRPSQTQTLF